MEKLTVIFFISTLVGLTAGNSISPVGGVVSGTEGQSVTLRCDYETSYDRFYLNWYRHHSDLQAPQFILYKGEGAWKGQDHIPDKRYESQTTGTSNYLTINRLTLADTGLYYCALLFTKIRGVRPRGGPALTFGNPIKLTVNPTDTSPLKPELFVLSPQGLPRSETDKDVCLATNFRPNTGEMVLNFHNSSQTVSTSEAVLSQREKSYFFAGFSKDTIKSCELLGESAQRKEPEPEILCENRERNQIKVEPAEPCDDLHPDKAKLNFYLVVMNAVRVMFTKTLAFNTIFTIRAVLF